ncbi:glycosyltransferase family 4 protein [Limnohabitans sp. MORI2]|uniref:glycosyltransferase family 4 protein n=1 Tax=Limnohabitans sp. MORI2 TaxID=1751150 RepID=UPI0024913993|nr:glycosyltransferase family 4 protein [Limnohabitans sp. MORI2]
MKVASRLNVDLAKQFAWLLRKDLREAFASKDDPGFAEWWLIKGRQEFPGWADSLDAEQLNALFASAGAATVAGVQIDVPKLASLLAKYRPDAVKEFAKDGKLQNELFFAWVVVRGLAEHQLAQHAPRSLVAALDQPVPDTYSKQGEPPVPAATLLMYLLWRLMDDKTQQARSLYTAQGRLAFLGWFFNVVGTLGIAPLVAGRWKAWVQSPEGAAALATQKTTAAKLPWLAPQTKQQAAAPSTAADKPFGLNIYGFAYGELGIGEDLRMAVECCEAAGIPYHVVNVDAGDARQADLHLKGKVSDGTELPPYNTNLFCLPAFDTVSRVFMQKGAAVFEGYRNIGWWPWELAVFPKAWKPYAFELVDEVWASSQFLYDMYQQATDKPVKLVPLAVSVERMKPYPRKHYGLPEKKFLFLYIFDFNSSVARKNPMAAVQAFKQAFKPTDNTVGLVLKTMNTKPNNPEWQAFLKECQTDKRIQLITETLDRPEVLGLINACDAYVSLHRAEGFGRTLAEAMLLGKPVIATNYSGNVDFMQNELAYPVDFELVNVEQNSYQWVSNEDSAKWATANLLESIHSFKKVSKAKLDKVDREKINLLFSSEVLSVIFSSSII